MTALLFIIPLVVGFISGIAFSRELYFTKGYNCYLREVLEERLSKSEDNMSILYGNGRLKCNLE